MSITIFVKIQGFLKISKHALGYLIGFLTIQTLRFHYILAIKTR